MTPATPGGDGSSVDRAQFDALLDGSDVVLAHFTAEWSRPCQRFADALDRVAADYPVRTVRIDIESNPALAAEFEVKCLPTVVLFVDGECHTRREGVCDPDALADLLATHVH